MKKILILFLALICFSNLYSQGKFFPEDLNIQPFTANFLEPKAGFNFFLGHSKLRMDIGTSEDIYHYTQMNRQFSFGGDLFTYTRLRSTKEFKFPVETVDYLFGVNFGYKVQNFNNEYGVRLRISHISTHLVDGWYNNDTEEWLGNRKPFVYSREFVEVLPYYKVKNLRVYLGFSYLFHTTPSNIGKDIYQSGFDYYFTSLTDKFSPFIAYDFKLSKIEKYKGNNILALGIKFGPSDKKGFSLVYNYTSGYSLHGQFYEIEERYSSIGFNLDF